MTYVQDGMVFELFAHYAVFIGLKKEDKKSIVEIPAFVKAIPVTKIKNNACSTNNDIKKIMLPCTMERIGDGAFWNCKNLEIVQRQNNSEEQCSLTIGEYAFSGCPKLVSFHAKTEIYIQEDAFAYSYKLGLLDGVVKQIDARAFNDTALDMLMLADNAEVLKDGLWGCKLKDIVCVRNAKLHSSATYIIQAKGINIHCPQTSNIVELAYLGVNVCTN